MKAKRAIQVDDTVYETNIPREFRKKPFHGMQNLNEVRAAIPGTIIDVLCKRGQMVSAGQVVLILDAMKMHNEIVVNGRGRILEIMVSPGDVVEKNQILIRVSGLN